MEIEKAIEALKMENELMQFDPNTGEDCPIELQNQDNQDLYNANLVAISALEKQLPKKVESFNSLNETCCPECRFVFGYSMELGEYDGEYYNYCVDCGQKLDWR
jgi:hypothetical protein